MAFSSKRKVLLIGAAIAILLLARHALPLAMNRFEVTQLCKSHVENNDEVIAEFGAVDLVPISMRVTHSESGQSGDFQFQVHGTKRSGRIAVTWEAAGSAENLHITQIYELRRFAPRKQIWLKQE